MSITLRPIQPGEDAFCEQVLRALPDWFAIEESLVQYVKDTTALPTWIALLEDAPAGFITMREHNPHSVEIHCMAILPEQRRKGVGRQMICDMERLHADRGFSYLQVKTVGPSRPCEHYSQTHRFYEAVGFVPLEEFPNLWPGNPCLLLVKRIG